MKTPTDAEILQQIAEQLPGLLQKDEVLEDVRIDFGPQFQRWPFGHPDRNEKRTVSIVQGMVDIAVTTLTVERHRGISSIPLRNRYLMCLDSKTSKWQLTKTDEERTLPRDQSDAR